MVHVLFIGNRVYISGRKAVTNTDKLRILRCHWLKHEPELKNWHNPRNKCYDYEISCDKCKAKIEGSILERSLQMTPFKRIAEELYRIWYTYEN